MTTHHSHIGSHCQHRLSDQVSTNTAECSTMPHSAWLDCRVLRSPSRVRCAGLRPPLTAPTGRSSAHPTHSDFKRGRLVVHVTHAAHSTARRHTRLDLGF